MVNLTERLRALVAKEYSELPKLLPDNIVQCDKQFLTDLLDVYDSLPQLLDRLDYLEERVLKLEKVVEVVSIPIVDQQWWNNLEDALEELKFSDQLTDKELNPGGPNGT